MGAILDFDQLWKYTNVGNVQLLTSTNRVKVNIKKGVLTVIQLKGLRQEPQIEFLAKLKIVKNNSKTRMWLCLHVLNTVPHLFSLV